MIYDVNFLIVQRFIMIWKGKTSYAYPRPVWNGGEEKTISVIMFDENSGFKEFSPIMIEKKSLVVSMKSEFERLYI